jgi:hypothetical protein
LAVLLPAVVSVAYVPRGAICQDYNTALDVSVSALKYVAPKWANNYELMNFNSIGGCRLDAGFPASVAIFGTFCTPKAPPKGHEKTILLATHGTGFDGR